MGTTWRILAAMPPAADPAPLRRAVETRLAALVAELSHWDPKSHLSRFNRAPAGTWATLPPDFAAVMSAALALAEQTGGAFDPTIGRIVDLWGFGPPGPQLAPSPEAIAQAKAQSGYHRLAWDTPARRLRQPGGLSLDLSGIAKGYAVDRIADLLAEHGHPHALVEIGGELVGRGIRPDGDPWWVNLEDPFAAAPPIRVALHGCAVATSGNYRRGEHTIDPRTAAPAANGVTAVSVIAPDAMHADAYATAIAVLGEEQGLAFARRLNLAARLLIREGDTVREALSSALAAMLAD